MKKFGRKSLIFVGGLLLVLVVLIVLTVVFMPVDQISQRVEAELEKATGAQVEVQGAGVQWWPKLGVTLKDITLEGTGATLAQATGSANDLGDYSLSLSRFVVQLAPGPLLKKEIFVEAILVKKLQMKAVLKDEPLVLVNGNVAITDLQISMESASESGQQSSQPNTKRPVGELIPEDLVLAFEGQAEALLVQGLPLTEVEFNGDLDQRILTVESVRSQLDSGELLGELELDYDREPAGWLDFDFKAKKVPAGVLLMPWAADLAKKLETNLDVSIRGNCILTDQDIIKQSLTASGEVSSEEGTLWARDWLDEILPYLGKRQDLADIQFSSLSHNLRIEQGKYVVENLEINGLDTQWNGKGHLGLDGTIDLGVLVKLPAGFTPDLGKLSFMADTLRDENGRVNLNLHLSGMSAKPKVGLDLGSLQDATKGKPGEALKKGLGGLLDKWKSR